MDRRIHTVGEVVLVVRVTRREAEVPEVAPSISPVAATAGAVIVLLVIVTVRTPRSTRLACQRGVNGGRKGGSCWSGVNTSELGGNDAVREDESVVTIAGTAVIGAEVQRGGEVR